LTLNSVSKKMISVAVWLSAGIVLSCKKINK